MHLLVKGRKGDQRHDKLLLTNTYVKAEDSRLGERFL